MKNPSPSLHASARIAGKKLGALTVRIRDLQVKKSKEFVSEQGTIILPKFVGRHVGTIHHESLEPSEVQVSMK